MPPSPEERLLLVIFDAEVLTWARDRALKPAGYATETAASVEEAIPRLATHVPDLVLVDLHLPGLSSKDLVAAMQGQELDMPVVLIGREGEEKAILEVLRLGASDFIIYPARETELVTVVERNLRLTRERRTTEHLRKEIQALRQERTLRSRQWVALAQLAEMAMELVKPTVFMPRALRLVAQALHADRAWLLLRVLPKNQLRLAAYYNLPPAFVEQAKTQWQDGVSSLVALSGETLVLDAEAIERFPLRALGKAAIIAPLKRGMETFALLGIARLQNLPFREDDRLAAEIAAGLLTASLMAGGTGSK